MLRPKAHHFFFSKRINFIIDTIPIFEGNHHLLLHEKKNLFRLQAILYLHFLEFNTCEMLFYDYYMTH